MAKHKHEQEAEAPLEETTPEVASPTPETPKASVSDLHAAFQKKLSDNGITLVPQLFNSLGGLKVVVSVPTSEPDFDTLAGKKGACLQEAIKNIVYRGALAVFRNEFCEALELKTGIARKYEAELLADGSEKKDEEGNVVIKKWEPEAVYVKRVAGDNPEQFQGLADSICTTLIFDPTAKEPKAPGTKKMAAVYLTTATQLFDQGRMEVVIAKLSEKLGVVVSEPSFTDGSDKDIRINILAGLIKEDQARKKLVNEYAS